MLTLSLERKRREPGKCRYCWVCAFPPPSGNGFGRERWSPAPVLGLAFPPGAAFPVGKRETRNGWWGPGTLTAGRAEQVTIASDAR